MTGQHGASGSGGRWLCLVDDRQRAWPGPRDAAVQRLRGWGCGWCRLSVLEENQHARRFYERRGWRLDGRRTRTPPHPPMVGYTLRLGAASAAGLVPT